MYNELMYELLAGILIYILVLRSSLSVLSSSLIVVFGNFIVATIFRLIRLLPHEDAPIIATLFDPSIILTVVIQLALALLIFYKIRLDEDSYMNYILWGGAGLAGIFFVAPYVASSLLT